jgi:hypothetical protein
MTGYVRNTFQAQTPIGQAMQNIAQSMFQARAMSQQQALQQQEMAMKQAEFDAKMPLIQAQTASANADAEKNRRAAEAEAANMASMKARPDTIASAFANLTRPQLGQVRNYQNTGTGGEAPTIAGLDNLGSGGDWMPTFANPETMQKVNQADMLTSMMGGTPQQADNIAKAMQMLSDMNFIQSNPDAAAAQTRGRATAATGGKALFGNPTSDGLIGDLFTGAILNTSNPMAQSEMGKDKAYSAHQYAGARQADAAAALNTANANAVPIKTANDTRKADAAVSNKDEYKKGMAESAVRGTVALVDTFLGIKKDKAGNVLEGTALRPEAYNAVLRDIEASGNTINATSVAQALQRIAQSNPGLVSVLPETGWTGMGDRTPQLRPQLRQQAGQRPAAQRPAAASGSVPRIKGEADYNALQPGQQYYDPKGVLRTKGGV